MTQEGDMHNLTMKELEGRYSRCLSIIFGGLLFEKDCPETWDVMVKILAMILGTDNISVEFKRQPTQFLVDYRYDDVVGTICIEPIQEGVTSGS